MSAYISKLNGSTTSKVVTVLVLLIACFGMTMGGLAQSGTAKLAYTPVIWSNLPVVQGTSANSLFTFTSSGSFQGNVSLTISGLPSGVTGTWSSSTVTLTSGVGTSTLTLTAGAATPVASTIFTVTAAGSGLTVTKSYSVQVQQSPGMTMKMSHQSLSMWSMTSATMTVTATPIGGVTVPANAAGASAIVVAGLPTGVSASWSAPTVTSAGAVTWLMTLTGSPYAVASTDTLNLSTQIVDANSGIAYSASGSIPLTVSFTTPTLSFVPAATTIPLVQGGSATDLFTFTSGGSFYGGVTLAVSGLPSGVTASWSSDPVPVSSNTASSLLTLTASPSATVNYFTFTVTATGDTLTLVKTYAIKVKPAIGVQAQLSQASLTIEPMSTATLSVTATPVNGITVPAGATGASAAVVSGLPAGVTASFSSPVLTSSGAVNWSLTLTADNTAMTGMSPIAMTVQITDASTGLLYSANSALNLLVSLMANISIGTTPGVTIPAAFMGISQEWQDAQSTMGDTITGVNTVYRQLLTNLTAYGSAPINVRIGGNSTDVTGEPTSTTVLPFAQLATALGSQFELGVNLGADNVSLATDQATAYAAQMPAGSLKAIEIGNEPDEYYQNGYRPSSYTVQDYYADFNTWQSSIMPVLPSGTGLMGASWAFLASMQANAPTFESNQASALASFSQHSSAASPANNPAPDFLLTPAAATTAPGLVAPIVASSHAQGIPFRMGENAAISDGGIQGISNSFSAALWAIDTMFEFSNVGVDGMNWFSSNGDYNSPFFFTNTYAAGGKIVHTLNSVNPIYYGLLFFQVALGDGAQMLPVTLSTPANLKAWATVPTARTPRVAIINKDENLSGPVAITMPGYSQATIEFLTAPSYSSSAGITFAGQTFDGTTSGRMVGSKSVETISGTNGVFQLQMPVTSAALVIFTK